MVKNIDKIVRIGESSKCIIKNEAKLDVIIKEAGESTIAASHTTSGSGPPRPAPA